MRTGLVTKKVGMTRLFDETGRVIPVTVLQVEDVQVVAHKTEEKDGYTAVQLGAFNQKPQRVSKPLLGHFKKAKVTPKRTLKEFRVSADNLLDIGSDVKADIFKEGQYVDVTGTTKGHGFSGAMKRWGFGGLRATHGVSISHRSLGSTGQCQFPGKVFKGKKMAGHFGAVTMTQQSVKVVKVDVEKNVVLVRGSIPGSKGGIVYLKDAVKKAAPKAE